MNYQLYTTSSLRMMLGSIRSALATDDSCQFGHEIYGVREFPDFRHAVRDIESTLTNRNQVFMRITW